jgi:hypothetical protein
MLSIYRKAWKCLDDKSFHMKKGPGIFRVCKGKDPEMISIKGKVQKIGLLTGADSEQPYLHQFLTYLLRFFCILFPMILVGMGHQVADPRPNFSFIFIHIKYERKS